MKNLFILFAALVPLFVWSIPSQENQGLPRKTYTVCGRKILLEEARSEKERQTGLMYRKSLPAGTGMLFIFEESQPLSFWMKNVPFDIEIGYFNAQGKLLNFKTMKGTPPMMLDSAQPSYPSEGPSRFAVETPLGFYKSGDQRRCVISPLPH